MEYINKKTFVILAFILMFGFANKTEAYAGVLDVVYDPANVVQSTVSAGSNVVTSGATVVTSAMTTAEKLKVFVLDPAARVAIKLSYKD